MQIHAMMPGLLASLVVPTSAFISFNCFSNIVEERADPIVSPKQVSSHVHKIAGGNAFDMNKIMTYEETQTSTCSSCPIKQDLSLYWTPKLYYQYENGSFNSVPVLGDNSAGDVNGGMTIYYL